MQDDNHFRRQQRKNEEAFSESPSIKASVWQAVLLYGGILFAVVILANVWRDASPKRQRELEFEKAERLLKESRRILEENRGVIEADQKPRHQPLDEH